MVQDALSHINIKWQYELMRNRKAIDHLKDYRGIRNQDLFKNLELGFVKIPEHNDLQPNMYKSLKAFGLFGDKYDGMISIPLRKKDNRISNFLFLHLNGEGDDRIIRKGGLINIQSIRNYRDIVIVDNLADYFSYCQNIKDNIIPIIESDAMIDDFIDALKNSNVREVHFINDSPYWESVKQRIQTINNSDLKTYSILLDNNLGLSEYIKYNTASKFLTLLNGSKETNKSLSSGNYNYFNVELMLGEVTFTRDDRVYKIRGFNRENFEKKVQITFELDDKVFPDRIDVSRSLSRNKFAKAISNEFEISIELIQTDLANIYTILDNIQNDQYKEKCGYREKNIHTTSTSDVTKTIDLLNSRCVLNEILIKDTERLGYLGEDINKKLFYLSATSRLTGKPLSVIDISPPGTGKSFGLSSIIELMPQNEVLKYSRLTPNTLYYKSEEELRNKVLYIEELVGMEDSLNPIRMLLSSGELAISSVEKDSKNGNLRTVERRIEVEIPVMTSGTRDLYDEETLSRFITTHNDNTLSHMEQVLKSQAMKYTLNGTKNLLQRDAILKRHRDIQKVLNPEILVINQYAEKIMLNPTLHIVTRKQEHYLRLIYNIAFLRQHLKEIRHDEDRSGNKFIYVEADAYDIKLANEIASHVFQYTRGDLSKRLHDAYQIIENYCISRIKNKRISIHEYKFTRRELREYANWNLSTTKCLLDELEKLEYVKRLKGSQGSEFLYRLNTYNNDNNLQVRDLLLMDLAD